MFLMQDVPTTFCITLDTPWLIHTQSTVLIHVICTSCSRVDTVSTGVSIPGRGRCVSNKWYYREGWSGSEQTELVFPIDEQFASSS